MKLLLNKFDNPKLSDMIFVGRGDKVLATEAVLEYGFTVDKEYEILGIMDGEYLLLQNDLYKIDSYSVEFFKKENKQYD